MNVVHKNELFQILNNQIGNIKQFYHMIMGCEVICLSFCYGIFHHFCFRLKMNRKTNFKYTSTFIKPSYILHKQYDCCSLLEETAAIVTSFLLGTNT